MTRLLLISLTVLLLGCGAMKGGSEVAEVPEDVWKSVKKQIDARSKPDPAAQKKVREDLEKLDKALQEIKR